MNPSSAKKLSTAVSLLAFLVLILGIYLGLSGKRIAADINARQMTLSGDGTYYPLGTAFLIAIPPMLVLVVIKKILDKKK